RHLQHRAIVGYEPSVRDARETRISGSRLGHTGPMVRVPSPVANVAQRVRRLPRALTRRHRSPRPTAPTASLAPQQRPWTRALGLVVVVILGAWLGLLVVGNVRVPVGPMDTTMT